MNKEYRNLRIKIWMTIFLYIVLLVSIVTLVFYLCTEVIFRSLFLQVSGDLSSVFGVDFYGFAISHKNDLLKVLLAATVLVAIYLGLRKVSDYQNQIGDAVRQVFSDQGKPIVLPDELKTIETDLNTIRYDLKQREMEAKLNEEQKNDLIVYLAHDLKTPLTSIIGYLSLIEESHDVLPEKEKDHFAHIAYEKSLRMEVLVDELFEITRFNAKSIPLTQRQIPLFYLLQQLQEEFYPLLQEKRLTCIIECEEDIQLLADGDQLARVFDNILRNAICYSDPGTEIRIQVEDTEEAVFLSFTNHGLIISEDQLEHIFDKFYRIDEARGSNSGGAGLGLAIAKIIVELHGGTIRASSDETGTCFSLCFPKKSPEKGD